MTKKQTPKRAKPAPKPSKARKPTKPRKAQKPKAGKGSKPESSADRDPKGLFVVGAKPGPGRESLYDAAQMNDMATKLALLGLTDEEMAPCFGISIRTFHDWKKRFPGFLHALQEGKIIADANVAQSMYQRACGQVVEFEKSYKMPDGKVEIVKLKTFVPGDTSAGALWLTNRTRRNANPWQQRQTVDVNSSSKPESLTDAQLAEIIARESSADSADEAGGSG